MDNSFGEGLGAALESVVKGFTVLAVLLAIIAPFGIWKILELVGVL